MYDGVKLHDLPVAVDWRLKGAVTDVKDKKTCGSCWAFLTVVSVEVINQIKTGNLVPLSEQELVDCDTSDNRGCNGGLMDDAFKFIKKSGDITTESNYPYRTVIGTCNSIMFVSDEISSDSDRCEDVANQPASVHQ